MSWLAFCSRWHRPERASSFSFDGNLTTRVSNSARAIALSTSYLRHPGCVHASHQFLLILQLGRSALCDARHHCLANLQGSERFASLRIYLPTQPESPVMDHNNHVRLSEAELNPANLEGATIYGPDDENLGSVSHVHGAGGTAQVVICLLYTSPSPRDGLLSRMPSSA